MNSPVRSPLPAVATLLALVAAGQGRAHVADEIVVTLDPVTLTETVTMTAETLSMLAPIDADADGELTRGDLDLRRDALKVGVWDQAKLTPCTRGEEKAWLEPGYVALQAKFTCAEGELSQEFRWLMVLPPNYRVVFGNQVAKGDTRTLHVQRPGWKTERVFSVTVPLLVWGLIGGLLATVVGFWLVRRLRP